MSRKSKKIQLMAGLAMVTCLFTVMDTSAAPITLAQDGDWSTPASWGGTAPGAGDDAYVNLDRTVGVTTDVGTIDQLIVGTTSSAGTVNITGGKLVTLGTSAIGRLKAGATGTLSISGGTYQSGDASGSTRLTVGVNSPTISTTGIIEISGTGTFIGRALIGSTVAGDSGDVFRIKGSNVTVGNTSTVGSESLRFDSGTMEWVFDSAGISTANFQESVVFESSAGIVVDGSAYTGGANTFTLLSATLSSTAPTITLTGFATGTTYEWDDNNTFTVTTIPEPATIGMLMAAGASMIWIRRKFII